MTISTFAKSLLAATLTFATPGLAIAMTHTSALSTNAPIIQAAMGCGMGRTRDAMGRCRHRFNLFDHHDRRHFDRYRDDHCTMIQTPNGRVRRCRI